MKIYVDGCSLTYGYGLDREYSLSNLLKTKLDIEIDDYSYPSKSNYTIALDLYSTKIDYDLYIIGWTYSSRIEFNINGTIIECIPSKTHIGLGNIPNGEFFEKEYNVLQNKFYRYASRLDVLSDFFIDSTASILKKSDKKFIFFSMAEQRNCEEGMLYPLFSNECNQTDGHLNETGMEKLRDLILEKINEQK